MLRGIKCPVCLEYDHEAIVAFGCGHVVCTVRCRVSSSSLLSCQTCPSSNDLLIVFSNAGLLGYLDADYPTLLSVLPGAYGKPTP